MRAQTLLETCSDTRVSNGITQLTTKYNALLSLAKEVMKRLELHYQVHNGVKNDESIRVPFFAIRLRNPKNQGCCQMLLYM